MGLGAVMLIVACRMMIWEENTSLYTVVFGWGILTPESTLFFSNVSYLSPTQMALDSQLLSLYLSSVLFFSPLPPLLFLLVCQQRARHGAPGPRRALWTWHGGCQGGHVHGWLAGWCRGMDGWLYGHGCWHALDLGVLMRCSCSCSPSPPEFVSSVVGLPVLQQMSTHHWFNSTCLPVN